MFASLVIVADSTLSAYAGIAASPQQCSNRALAPLCSAVATAEAKALSSISAAPPAETAAFDLAEQLSTQTLPHGPWRHAFRGLLTDESFLKHGWAKMPFKLEEEWRFAVGSYTMEDVERDEHVHEHQDERPAAAHARSVVRLHDVESDPVTGRHRGGGSPRRGRPVRAPAR